MTEKFLPMEESEMYKWAMGPRFGKEATYQRHAWVDVEFVPYGDPLRVETGKVTMSSIPEHIWRDQVNNALRMVEAGDKQIKELQDLLAREKERATMFRKQRDDLQARLDEIGDIAGR